MEPILHDRYFRPILSSVLHGDKLYWVFKPICPVLALCSTTTSEFLQGWQVRCQTSDGAFGSGKAVVVERRDSNPATTQLFQVMVSKNNQELEFIETNFTGIFVNSNLMRRDVSVKATDPGPGDSMNQVNELKPYQSYAVRCDQATGLAFLLRAAEKASAADPDKKVPVKIGDDEKEKPVDQLATQIWLSTLPENGSSPEHKAVHAAFAKTRWCIPNFVVICRPKPAGYRMPIVGTEEARRGWARPAVEPVGPYRGRLFGGPGYGGQLPPGAVHALPAYGRSTISLASSASAASFSFGGGGGARAESADQGDAEMSTGFGVDEVAYRSAGPSSSSTGSGRARALPSTGSRALSALSDGDGDGDAGSMRTKSAASTKGIAKGVDRGGDRDRDRDRSPTRRRQRSPNRVRESSASRQESKKSKAKGVKKSKSASKRDESAAAEEEEAAESEEPGASAISEQDALDATAGTLMGGRAITERSDATGRTYNYERSSNKCVLKMAVAEKLRIKDIKVTSETPATADEIKEAEKELQAYIRQEQLVRLNSVKKYDPPEECTVCMDAKPDFVLFTCGHQCLCGNCVPKIDTCPLCRGDIVATIKAAEATHVL